MLDRTELVSIELSAWTILQRWTVASSLPCCEQAGVNVQAVVGAGAAGFAAAKELQQEESSMEVFEQSSCIDGTWVLDARTESDLLGQDP